MIDVAALDREIAETEAKLRRLHEQKRAAQRSQTDRLVVMFNAGKSFGDISTELGIPYGSVQGRLWRAGLTLSGRIAIKKKLRDVGAHGGASA